ncbi:MAG: Tad domain-containing protein [Actinobacteria bacterium]|nr:Tad domain-containing protein [Actinomycetota bacterium]
MKIKRFKSENGAVVVIVALSIIALMMVTALAIDVGSLYEERRHLQTVADAAALAGVQELPEDVDGAINVAIEYGSKHGLIINSSDVIISSTLAEDDTITVNAINPNAPLYFARVIGLSHTQVVASATAMIASPEEHVGVVPWGVPQDSWDPGEEVVLKYGSGPPGGGVCGNYQPLTIDSPGGSEYKDNIIDGASTPLSVGDMIETLTGNKVGKTLQGVNERVYGQHNNLLDGFFELVAEYIDPVFGTGYKLTDPDSQFIYVPIIDGLGEVHGHDEVEIVAFAPFIITGIHDMHDPVYGHGISITGTFLSQALVITEGSIIPVQSGGLRVVRLID